MNLPLHDNHKVLWNHWNLGETGWDVYATWPATKRTKASPKALKTNPLAWWHCTRKQLYAGPELSKDPEDWVTPTAKNDRQGWGKDGNTVEWPWKEGK